MQLPKLYRVVHLKFWSLRNTIGSSYGVIFDHDTMIIRRARRVLSDDGWKWQIAAKNWEWRDEGHLLDTDQECLNECIWPDDLNLLTKEPSNG